MRGLVFFDGETLTFYIKYVLFKYKKVHLNLKNQYSNESFSFRAFLCANNYIGTI